MFALQSTQKNYNRAQKISVFLSGVFVCLVLTRGKTMNNCSTCHWWTKSFGEKDGRSVCVWHSGTKDVENRKVDFGGSKPFRTTADFGCVCWSVDERKFVDQKSILA